MREKTKGKLSTAFLVAAVVAADAAFLGNIFLMVGCPDDPQTATRALEPTGLKHIVITGKGKASSCPYPAFFRTEFQAVNSNGKKVNGVVCEGLKFLGGKTSISFDK